MGDLEQNLEAHQIQLQKNRNMNHLGPRVVSCYLNNFGKTLTGYQRRHFVLA